MAIGLQQFTEKNTGYEGNLLDESTGVDNGTWMNVIGMDKISVHIVLSSGADATVNVCGSNEDAPDNNTDGIDLVAAGLTNIAAANNNIVANAMVAIKLPLRWIKVKVGPKTGTRSGTVSAKLVAV